MSSSLLSLSPLDGRYARKTEALHPIFSEYGLHYHRLFIEIRWLITLAQHPKIVEIEPFSEADLQYLEKILTDFNGEEAQKIATIEKTTNHDVKAVEYYLRERLESNHALFRTLPFVHFACTSEDINNLSYALMVKKAVHEVLLPALQSIQTLLEKNSQRWAATPMLSRTHGQAATPTTMGKEFKNIAARLARQCAALKTSAFLGKINGAVGNFNAHVVAYPEVDWLALSEQFVTDLGLSYNAFTTQIEPHDALAELLHHFCRINTILIDSNRDLWGYISLGYITQKRVEHEVGSSTMPHKINPIDFENAEGNLGLANALASHMAEKLPISRWQRDLSDSTVLRNLGSVFGYCLLAYQSMLQGLHKIDLNPRLMQKELDEHWEILSEPVQMMLRRFGEANAYEQLKHLSRGERLTRETLHAFIDNTPLPAQAKAQLKQLTPSAYVGLAERLALHKASTSTT